MSLVDSQIECEIFCKTNLTKKKKFGFSFFYSSPSSNYSEENICKTENQVTVALHNFPH